MFAAYCPRFPSFLVFFLLCRIWGKKISHEIILVGSIAIKSPFLLVKLYHYMWRSCGNLPHIVMIQPLLNTVSVSKYSIDDFLLRTRKIFIDTIYRYYLYIDTIYIYITSKEFFFGNLENSRFRWGPHRSRRSTQWLGIGRDRRIVTG